MTKTKEFGQVKADKKNLRATHTVEVSGALLRPDLRYTANGIAVFYFTLAGEVQEGDRGVPYYLNAKVIGDKAVPLSEALKEGDLVAVQGILNQYRKEGGEEKTSILAQRVYRTEGRVNEAGRLLDGRNSLSGYAKVVGEPQKRALDSGAVVTSVRVLLQGNGEEVAFLNLDGWEELGEKVAALRKGDGVLLEARLQSSSWTDQAGTRRYATKLVARHLTVARGVLEGASAPKGGSGAVPNIDEDLFLDEEDLPF